MNAFYVATVTGSFNSWEKVPSSKGKLFTVAFASSSAFEFSPLSMCFNVNPWNLRSNDLTVARYLMSSGSLAIYSFSTCLAMI